MSFEDSDFVTWKLRGKLICNDKNYNWDINLFCDGESVKLSESVKNDDGGYSLHAHEDKYYNWGNEATGIIIEKKDTIGKFFIIMNPLIDSILKQITEKIYSQTGQLHQSESNSFKEALIQFAISDAYIDYGIVGIFRENIFTIIADGNTKKIWFFEEGDLKSIFQADMKEIPFSKIEKIKPYLLLDSSITDNGKPDWFRLAIFSKFLANTLRKSKT